MENAYSLNQLLNERLRILREEHFAKLERDKVFNNVLEKEINPSPVGRFVLMYCYEETVQKPNCSMDHKFLWSLFCCKEAAASYIIYYQWYREKIDQLDCIVSQREF